MPPFFSESEGLITVLHSSVCGKLWITTTIFGKTWRSFSKLRSFHLATFACQILPATAVVLPSAVSEFVDLHLQRKIPRIRWLVHHGPASCYFCLGFGSYCYSPAVMTKTVSEFVDLLPQWKIPRILGWFVRNGPVSYYFCSIIYYCSHGRNWLIPARHCLSPAKYCFQIPRPTGTVKDSSHPLIGTPRFCQVLLLSCQLLR